MAHHHLDIFLLLRVAEGSRPPEALVERVVAHHRESCAECDRVYREFEAVRDRRRAPERTDYSAAFDAARRRALDAAVRLDAERPRAEADLHRLLDLRSEERRAAVESARSRYSSPLLVELLIDEARPALRRDPEEAYDLLDLAEAVALQADVRFFGKPFLARLLVRVDAHRANVLRVAGELHGADAVWRTLHQRLEAEPVGDLELEAELASFEASLRQDQRRFRDAERLLARSARLYRTASNHDGEVKVLLQRGYVRLLAGEPDEALPLMERAVEVADPESNPFLYLTSRHNLALCHCEMGDFRRAVRQMAANRPLYERFDDPSIQLSRAWLEGRVARGLERFDAAEQRLVKVRNQYLSQGMGYDAALVTLDLAELFFAQGRTFEVRRLAEAMVPVFDLHDIHREAIAALMLFKRAATAETVSRELLLRLRSYLLSARNDPRFRFEQTG